MIEFLTFMPGTPSQPERFIDPSEFIYLIQVGIQIKLSDNLISFLLQDIEVEVTETDSHTLAYFISYIFSSFIK